MKACWMWVAEQQSCGPCAGLGVPKHSAGLEGYEPSDSPRPSAGMKYPRRISCWASVPEAGFAFLGPRQFEAGRGAWTCCSSISTKDERAGVCCRQMEWAAAQQGDRLYAQRLSASRPFEPRTICRRTFPAGKWRK